MDSYAEFIDRKSLTAPIVGIEHPRPMPDAMKRFQSDLTQWSLRRGRAALFEGTGLGKTVQQLAWADEIVKDTRGQVLILAPLGVTDQTIGEAAKFNIDGIAYAHSQEDASSPIVISNYERMGRFDMERFDGIVLDESSIIKSHDSKTRKHLIEACERVPYKLCCTATPAPNDWIEIGNHAEFLGVMTEKEMLSMFFVHDGSVRAGGGSEWRLKGHAKSAFWEWMSSWAAMIRSPADLGYDEPGYILPPLYKHQVTVPVEYAPAPFGTLFPMEAATLSERIAARRNSIAPRIDAVMKIIPQKPSAPQLIWCGLNDEQDALEEAIGSGYVSICGSDKPEEKIERCKRWLSGQFPIMISKPSIFGYGMNFQHCADMTFVGLNDSFEQLFQAIRRCWRFGQTRPVNVHLIASELEGAVVKNLEAKERDFDVMTAAMAEQMRDFTMREVRQGRRQHSTYNAVKTMEIPAWL